VANHLDRTPSPDIILPILLLKRRKENTLASYRFLCPVMDDSPLSITANVAGILTFISAIIAFVYVRYQILQSGIEEIFSNLEDAVLNVDETKLMQFALLQNPERHGTERIRQRLYRLLWIDFDIWKKCVSATTGPIPHEVIEKAIEEAEGDLRRAALIAQPVRRGPGWRSYKSFKALRSYRAAVDVVVQSQSMLMSLIWHSLNVVLGLSIGLTPQLLRWYGVRKEVIKQVQQRNMLRSQIAQQNVVTSYVSFWLDFAFTVLLEMFTTNGDTNSLGAYRELGEIKLSLLLPCQNPAPAEEIRSPGEPQELP
jgi:hypothetical protein